MSTSTRLLAVIAFSFFSSLSFAQSTGTVQGTLADASGAAVPSAAITVHNEATGLERSLVTDASGEYSIPSLPVGSYEIDVNAPAGMASLKATNIVVAVGTIRRQDFTWRIASDTRTA